MKESAHVCLLLPGCVLMQILNLLKVYPVYFPCRVLANIGTEMVTTL